MSEIALSNAIHLSLKILCLGLTINTFEYLYLLKKNLLLEFYPWNIIKKKSLSIIPYGKKNILNFLLIANIFLIIFTLITPSAISIGILFLIQWMIYTRFGSPFNGGADLLQLLIIFCLFCYYLLDGISPLAMIPILYLAIQVIFSYIIAGLKKLKNKNWINGQAIMNLVQNSSFAPPNFIKKFFQIQFIAFLIGISVLLFEIGFIFYLRPNLTIPILILGLSFHFMNFFIFGLNRFFLTWAATYPILLFFAHFIQSKFF